MKANELMIGDWVEFIQSDGQGFYAQVEALNNDGTFAESGFFADNMVKPIPLTKEILEKNGFEDLMSESEEVAAMFGRKPKPMGVWQYGFGQFDSVSYLLKRSFLSVKFMEGYTADIANIKYVHELQHALRLCGVEKEIEL